MNTIREHGPFLVLMLLVVFVAFGRIMQTPIWDVTDVRILCDAHELNQDPLAMFRHLGFYLSQPLLQLAFLAEYRVFGLEPAGYMAVNLTMHAVNAFVVYMLVHMLFPQRRMAVLAALLFALAVGSYGRTLTSIHQMENLMVAGLHLLVLYFFIRNDFRRDGQLRSPLFALGLGVFLLAGLTRDASFSLVAVLVAYKAFFHQRRGRRIITADVMIFLLVALVFHWAQARWGYRNPTVFDDPSGPAQFTLVSIKNVFRYLNLMFFPMQESTLLRQVPSWVSWLYDARTVIRVFVSLGIIAYSFFGFVFGSRAIRFFIAWTYITVIPFTSQADGGSWLNLSHLYLTSTGFCVVLASAATGTSSLLRARRWRRLLPYAVPLAYVLVSLGLTERLNQRHLALGTTPEVVQMRMEMTESCRRPLDDSERSR